MIETMKISLGSQTPTDGSQGKRMKLRLIDGIPVFGDPVDEGALSQIKTCAKTANRVALMADHHKGYAVPIGGVVAYQNAISPSGVGFDIGCGNKAVMLDADPADVRENIETIMDDIVSTISFGVGRINNEKVDHELFDDERWGIRPISHWKQMARDQLGTVGSGNHYVDIFEDQSSHIWIGVHFGSRGLGHKIATYFLKEAGASDGMDVEPCVLSLDSYTGSDYIEAMHLAGLYAYAGRDWVCERVAKIIGAKIVDSVHNHHNYAWNEVHDGTSLIVVRKGATPAFPGQRGFIGGSMGESAVIVEGLVSDISEYTLSSTIHGAGRVMSRTAARGKIHRKSGRIISIGAISKDDMNEWLREARVVLRGGGVDEAPQAYKRLPQVLKHHEGTIKITHVLNPLGVAMAGEHEFDPYKD